MAFVTRFAPSPTGLLHLGHAFSALTAFDAARAAGGTCLLRIEDIDATRRRPAFEAAIREDLAWLGLIWPEPVRRQSEHMADYAAALAALDARGLLYRCFRTRADLAAESLTAPHGPDVAPRPGRHSPDDEARALEEGRAFAWRLDLDRALAALAGRLPTFEADGAIRLVDPARIGDPVLARKDVPVSYHLACVHDDALQGVTHVIRGEDLIEAVHVQVLLQALLDLPTPAYRHHRLILDAQGRRLAKRDRAATLAAMREAGATPADVRRAVGLEGGA